MSVLLQLLIMGVTEGGIYGLIAGGVVLVAKSTQVVSMAHGQLLAFAALFFYCFFGLFGLPVVIAILLTFIAAGILGLLIERLTLRPMIGQPLFAAFMVTFAVFVFLDGVFQVIMKGSTKIVPPFMSREVLHIGKVNIPEGELLNFFISLILFGFIGLLYKYTKIGIGMRATAEDHRLAQSVGISVKKIFSVIWVLSAMVSAVAGILMANMIDIYYTFPYLGIKGLIVALLGGLESIPGAFLGGSS